MSKHNYIGQYQEYTNENGLHKHNGPALIWADGVTSWWLNGKPHRYYGLQSYGGTENGCWWIHGAIKWCKG